MFQEFDVAMIDKATKRMLGITLPNKKEEVSAIYYDKKISITPQGNIDHKYIKI